MYNTTQTFSRKWESAKWLVVTFQTVSEKCNTRNSASGKCTITTMKKRKKKGAAAAAAAAAEEDEK